MATTSMRSLIEKMLRGNRLTCRLEEFGIKARTNTRHLDRMTNVRWHNGMLHDATCHYSSRFEISGNTFPIKEMLKQEGFSWDPGDRCWWRKLTRENATSEAVFDLSSRLIRHLKGR